MKKIAFIVLVVVFSFSFIRSNANVLPEGFNDKTVFTFHCPDIHAFIAEYNTSSPGRFLQEKQTQEFIKPLIRHLNGILAFWADHFQISLKRLQKIVKDEFMVFVVTVSPADESRKAEFITIVRFKPNLAETKKWIAEYEERLPEKITRRALNESIPGLTFLHYYIKKPVHADKVFEGNKNSINDELLQIEGLYEEHEVSITYGVAGEYCYLIRGGFEQTRTALTNKNIVETLTKAQKQTSANTPCFNIQSSIHNLIENDILRGSLLKDAVKIMGLNHALIKCELMQGHLDITLTFHKNAPSVKTPLSDNMPFKYLNRIPETSDWFVLSSLHWSDVWKWFDNRVAGLSEKFKKYEQAVLVNFEKTTKQNLSRLFTETAGNETLLFPLVFEDTTTGSVRKQPVFFLELADPDYFISLLRTILKFVGQLTYFNVSESRYADGTMFRFRERLLPEEARRRLVFWIGEEFMLVSGMSEDVEKVLTRAPSTLRLESKIDRLQQSGALPLLVIYWKSFNLTPLFSAVRATAEGVGLSLDKFNKQIVDFEHPIPSSVFNRHFGNAYILAIDKDSALNVFFKVGYASRKN